MADYDPLENVNNPQYPPPPGMTGYVPTPAGPLADSSDVIGKMNVSIPFDVLMQLIITLLTGSGFKLCSAKKAGEYIIMYDDIKIVRIHIRTTTDSTIMTYSSESHADCSTRNYMLCRWLSYWIDKSQHKVVVPWRAALGFDDQLTLPEQKFAFDGILDPSMGGSV